MAETSIDEATHHSDPEEDSLAKEPDVALAPTGTEEGEASAQLDDETKALRTRIAEMSAELGELRGRRRHGLVWEEHDPETFFLPPGQDVKEGTRVRVRHEKKGDAEGVVRSIKAGTATVVRDKGREEAHSLEDLCACLPFDEAALQALVDEGIVQEAYSDGVETFYKLTSDKPVWRRGIPTRELAAA